MNWRRFRPAGLPTRACPDDVGQPASGSIRLDLPLHLIQSIRLCHAVMESDFDVFVPPEAAPTFSYLQRYFDFEYRVGEAGVPLFEAAEIRHEEPYTRVGALAGPLIFPHGIVARCRAKWRTERQNRFFFCGLLTADRKVTLERWLAGVNGRPRQLEPAKTRYLRRSVRRGSAMHAATAHGDVLLRASDRGRRLPEKAWDEDYHDLLGQSQFVLCPNGDFVWTYRFFEGILCGALPVVEDRCSAYDGFTYASMSDGPSALVWSLETAEENYARAVDQLTVRREALNRSLARVETRS